MQMKLKILAVIHIMFGGSGLLVGLVMLAGLARDSGHSASGWLPQIILVLWAVYFLPAFAGGIGLLTGRRWARWMMIAVSCVVLLAVPFGTILGAFGLWTLLGKDAGRTLIVPSAFSSLPKPDNGALTAALGVASGFVVALNFGFIIHEQRTPSALEALFLPAIIGLVLSLVLGLRWMLRRRDAPDVTSRQD